MAAMPSSPQTGPAAAESRITGARRRARAVKVGIVAVAATGFAVAASLARSAHPGAGDAGTRSTGGTLSPPERLTGQLDQAFSPGDIGPPAGGAPQAQSRAS